MKKNLLFFTLILSGLSTHVFAGKSTYKEGPLEIQTLEEMLKKIKNPELKREVEELRAKYEDNLAKKRGPNSYMEAKKPSSYKAPEPERETSEDRLNKIESSELQSQVKELRAGYERSEKVRNHSSTNVTTSSENKKNTKSNSPSQRNFEIGGKSTYQEGPLDPVEKSEYKLKKYDTLNYREPTESSESKKDSKRTHPKQENFKFGGQSTYQEGPLDPVEETPRQKQLKDKVGTRFGKDSSHMRQARQHTAKITPSNITSTTSEEPDVF
ncbi:MAG: hypothetical protein BGO07_00550 [Alphaproteobacteria bacterium 40-19]|nr:MAG: hypothetical protein BGO07_00550 [Alphaproteobacteria bacterium 40-19]